LKQNLKSSFFGGIETLKTLTKQPIGNLGGKKEAFRGGWV
jgi:hypothetical protein